MNLLDIAGSNGRTYKRVSSIHGGEYHGPCPICTSSDKLGTSDRFHIWPDQGEHGTFWCRSCKLGGDAIEYLMKIEGLSFPVACNQVGKELTELEEYAAPVFKKPAGETFQPRTIAAPADAWQEHALKFVTWAHEQLLENPEELAYLKARGIPAAFVEKYRLGYNSGEKGKDLYKAREAWGLETAMNGDKKKKLWLPIGITIPYFSAGSLRRVRIRIPADRRTEKFSVPYYLVPGSSMDSFITRGDAKAYVITEAELDAIAIDSHAGDLVGAVAMGNSSAKPTDAAFKLLSDCLHICNALDYDAKIENGKYENAGGASSLWWKKQFPQSERWPIPVGKDPGDAFKAGIDLREWLKAGLPPVLTLPPAPKPTAKPAPPVVPDDHKSGAVISAAATGDGTAVEAVVAVMRVAKDGRSFYITENKTEYARLVAAGEIVFDHAEIALAKQTGATPEQAAHFLTAKQAFPGCRLTEVTVEQEAAPSKRQGKYSKQETA